jgi:hypothetical protein
MMRSMTRVHGRGRAGCGFGLSVKQRAPERSIPIMKVPNGRASDCAHRAPPQPGPD